VPAGARREHQATGNMCCCTWPPYFQLQQVGHTVYLGCCTSHATNCVLTALCMQTHLEGSSMLLVAHKAVLQTAASCIAGALQHSRRSERHSNIWQVAHKLYCASRLTSPEQLLFRWARKSCRHQTSGC
jgi:hypothetical protein